MSKYLDWILQQDKEFIIEVCKKTIPTSKFKDYNLKAITLEELEQLDDKYIFSSPVADNLERGAQE